MSSFEPEAARVGIRAGRADREEPQDDGSSHNGTISISSASVSSINGSSGSIESPSSSSSSGLHSGRGIDEESPDSAQRKREHSDGPESLSSLSSSQQQQQPHSISSGDEDSQTPQVAVVSVEASSVSAAGNQEEEALQAPSAAAAEGEGVGDSQNEEEASQLTESEYSEDDDDSEQWEEAVSSAEEGSIPFESDDGSSSSSSDSDSSADTPNPPAAEAAAGDSAAAETAQQLGCSHYRRKCKIVAPCCKEIYWCRHCHNEAYESDLVKAHEIDRHAVEEIVCAVCETRQSVYHCDECGICRSGGRENYFHCPTCGSCYPLQLQNKHKCLENAMRRQCPVCLEDMFTSLRQSQVLQCGHTIHADCLRLLQKQKGFQAIRCPMCSKSIADYSAFWRQLSEEIERTPLEQEMQRKVRVACNDCLERSTTDFHFLGLKCMHCNSFNTRDVAED
ncbi:zinc finger (CHY type) protein, putative [Eimeria acervulina]|uniref:Zinc finger (CHY type) protein, putative n=1 Tax=Eimeria acervulina TaxID=5801 RepID=U6G9J8_EIMAC|nr:zinc finger (CHY type) protein, putative [Eimeria acervulina]CDI76202.1 zinc finger (CHY type) protein, putative [Eimeria acervulina]